MKHTLLSLFLTTMISVSSYSQTREVIFSESFDNGWEFPAGWTTMGVGLNNWSIVGTSQAGGSPKEVHLSWEPEFEGIARLVSPVIDLTGISSIGIQFSHNLYFWDEGITLGIATSSDNGATWNVGWSHEYTSHSEVTVISESIATEDVGSANFRFCLFVDGHSFNFDDWWFDDFSVFNMVNFDAGITNILVDDQQLAGNQEVACVVGNMGHNEITTLEFNYQFDDEDVITEFFEVNLTSFADTSLTFQEQAIVYEGLHELKIWISQVNGGADGSAVNDTLLKEINVTLGYTERIPMLEIFSSSTCAPCVGVNQEILALLAQNHGRYTVSKYQMNWPGSGDIYYTAEGGTRRGYYSVSGVPDAYIDGTEFYPYTQEEFDDAADEKSFVDIKGAFNMDGTTIHATVDVMSFGTLSNATMYVIVNEKTTTGNVGSNDETEFHHVMMKFLPDAQGTILNMMPGEHQHFEFNTNLSSTHIEEFDDLEVSVFVQNHSTKYVYNSHFLYEYSDFHPSAPSSLTLTDNKNQTMTAEWTAPEGNNHTGYNLYINGELILENSNVTTYTANTPNGLYIVEVLANYPEEQTSVKLAKSIIVSENVATTEIEDRTILLYPNPAKDVVNILGANVLEITIYDNSGKMMDVVSQKSMINVSDYQSGIYYLMITNSDGKRIVKKLLISR